MSREGWKRDLAVVLGVGAGTYVGWKVLQKLSEESLEGEVALVTGGSRGLGYLLAEELLRSKCHVVICARDEAELKRARERLSAFGDLVVVRCDVSHRTEVEQMIRFVTAQYGRIDLVINNAGIIEVGPLEAMTHDDFQRAMETIYWGTVNVTLSALPSMRARRHGRIVNVASIGGRVALPHLLPYSGAKFAVVGFSEGLRAEVTKDGIHVTTVIPGLMRTGSYVQAEFKGDREREFAWFSVASTMPGLTMQARRAAREIVAAIRRREAEVILTIPARLLALFHALVPGTTTRILSAIDRTLPIALGPEPFGEIGFETEKHVENRILQAATRFGRSAGEENLER